MLPPPRRGFSLVELLVVVTIIVVLLALLMPVMDKAVYQAELAVCGSRLKAIGVQVTVYAHDHRRHYPLRRALDPEATGRAGLPSQSALRAWNRWTRPDVLVDVRDEQPVDDRPALAGYLDAGGFAMFHDPLTGRGVDFTVDDYSIFIDYNLWYGMRVLASIGGGKGMLRLGDRLEWLGRGYDVLGGDRDVLLPNSAGWQKAWASHPDDRRVLYPLTVRSPREWHVSWWEANATHERGRVDDNFVYADGSVVRITGVEWNDDRMVHMPPNPFVDPDRPGTPYWMHMPR
jgi:prepilin-type N-terminal cleavage/methylation domain-containing protein